MVYFCWIDTNKIFDKHTHLKLKRDLSSGVSQFTQEAKEIHVNTMFGKHKTLVCHSKRMNIDSEAQVYFNEAR